MSAAGFSKISEREKKKFIWICVIKRITSIIAVAVTSKIPFFRTQSNIAAHMPRRLWHRQGKGERPLHSPIPLSPCLINRDLHLKEGWVNVMSIPVGGGENRERERGSWEDIKGSDQATGAHYRWCTAPPSFQALVQRSLFSTFSIVIH